MGTDLMTLPFPDLSPHQRSIPFMCQGGYKSMSDRVPAFCSKHMYFAPFGRINGPCNQYFVIQPPVHKGKISFNDQPFVLPAYIPIEGFELKPHEDQTTCQKIQPVKKKRMLLGE